MIRLWNILLFFASLGTAAGRRLRATAQAVWQGGAARRRLLIVVAALLVCSYALCVLGYVVVTPEIGVRWAFTPVVNHFYRQFLDPPDQADPNLLKEGDVVVAIAGHPVENWSQLMRKVEHLRDEPAESGDEELLADDRPRRAPLSGRIW